MNDTKGIPGGALCVFSSALINQKASLPPNVCGGQRISEQIWAVERALEKILKSADHPIWQLCACD